MRPSFVPTAERNFKMTQHDKVQDARIDGLEAAIDRQTKILADLRKFHMPWIDSEWQTKIRMKIVLPLVKFGAAASAVTIVINALSWYITDRKVEAMAARYGEVANRLFYEEKDTSVALEFMDKAIALREKNPDYRFRRAFMAGSSLVKELLRVSRPLTEDETDRVHHALAEAVFLKSLEPERFEPHILEGQVQSVLKNYDKALKAYEQALKMAPDNLMVLTGYAECALKAGKHDLAGELLSKAEAVRPDSKWLLLQRGEYEHQAHRDGKKAREYYEKFLAAFPNSARAWHDFSWTWISRDGNDYAQARDAARRALEIDPNYKQAAFAMGMFYNLETNMPAARLWFDRAVQLDANYLEAIKWRGIVRGELADWSGAAADFEKAITLDPMNADIYFRRARVMQKQGDLAQARLDVDFALELKPTNARYLKLKEELTNKEAK